VAYWNFTQPASEFAQWNINRLGNVASCVLIGRPHIQDGDEAVSDAALQFGACDCGLISTDALAVDRVVALLHDTVMDESCVAAAGSAAGTARRIWTVGFWASRGVTEALALLLHEKARLPAVASSPSGFRHGLVEASAAGDCLVVIECRDEDPPLAAYFDLLANEGQRVGLKIAWLAGRDRAGLNVRLRGSTQAERALEAVVRVQQLAHRAAHAAETYADGFRVLGRNVDPGKSFA
jgi:fructoselysine-6-P-deglycase FrlB-like protein